jgi:hypothetical protein
MPFLDGEWSIAAWFICGLSKIIFSNFTLIVIFVSFPFYLQFHNIKSRRRSSNLCDTHSSESSMDEKEAGDEEHDTEKPVAEVVEEIAVPAVPVEDAEEEGGYYN